MKTLTIRRAMLLVLFLGLLAVRAQDTPIPVARPVARPTPAQPLPAATNNDIARWLAGLPAEGPALQNFALVPAWKQHALRELTSREQSKLAVIGGISLLSWLTAITAGRMIGYW